LPVLCALRVLCGSRGIVPAKHRAGWPLDLKLAPQKKRTAPSDLRPAELFWVVSDYFLPFFFAAFFLAAISHSPPFDARERGWNKFRKVFSRDAYVG
jgi:hypothetical protein